MVNYVNLDQSSFTSDDVVRRYCGLESLGNLDKLDKSMKGRDTALFQEFHASYSLEVSGGLSHSRGRETSLYRAINAMLREFFIGWSRDWREMSLYDRSITFQCWTT
jgi:hypothetical protein